MAAGPVGGRLLSRRCERERVLTGSVHYPPISYLSLCDFNPGQVNLACLHSYIIGLPQPHFPPSVTPQISCSLSDSPAEIGVLSVVASIHLAVRAFYDILCFVPSHFLTMLISHTPGQVFFFLTNNRLLRSNLKETQAADRCDDGV